MLSTGLIAGFMPDEFITSDADAMTREYSQDLAVALALGDHCALNPLCRNILLLMMAVA